MQKQSEIKYRLLFIIFFLYLIPLSALSLYTFQYINGELGWELISLSFLTTFVGTALLFTCLLSWEKTFSSQKIPMSNSVAPVPSIEEAEKTLDNSEKIEIQESLQEEMQDLKAALERLSVENQELQQLNTKIQADKQRLENEHEEAIKDCSLARQELQQMLEEKSQEIAESKKTINDLRASIEKKHQYVSGLETKVRDLNYEIKTLLQLANLDAPSIDEPVKPPVEPTHFDPVPVKEKAITNWQEASALLKRCIDAAQKQTASNHYHPTQSRFKEFGVDNYAFDLRQLLDNFRFENSGLIVFFSPRENKVLFANHCTKNLFGMGPDKFSQHFFDLIEPSLEEWKHAVSQLALKNEVKTHLTVQNKHQEPLKLNALLGIIPTGLFRQQIIAVMFTVGSQ